jgi:bifunctional UDP-N-acetylglucosamine pyrophosphorylase/glucosamine-1-phosphate N-acetyltransferase
MAKINLPTFAGVVYATGNGEASPSSIPPYLQPLSGQPAWLHTFAAVSHAVGAPATLLVEQEIDSFSGEYFSGVDLIHFPENSSIINEIASRFIEKADHLLLVPAEMPLLAANTLQQINAVHAEPIKVGQSQAVMTVVYARSSARLDDDNNLQADLDQTPVNADQKQGVDNDRELGEFPTGVFCVSVNWLWEIREQIPTSLSPNDLLPDLIQLDKPNHHNIRSITIKDSTETMKIESLVDLSEAETTLRLRTNHKLMRSGVIIIDPRTTYIDYQVEIGKNSVIHPNTHLRGQTRIGDNCQIGPNSMITNTEIGDRCEVTFSVAEGAILEDDVDIGPFARLRKGAHLAQGVHMGNYGEVKNSYLGPGTKMGHFSYIGDADIGPEVNIGAGVITANYDGVSKYPTEIGAGAFIGSDTMLIAPLRIGAGARTGAGSVVNKDVPPNSLAVGIPARIIRKKEEKDGP